MSKAKNANDRTLLSTVTGEVFQPVRLYYAVTSQAAVVRSFKSLKCMDEDTKARCWVWLYEREAAKLTFGKPRTTLPPNVHPIVIGRFHLTGDGMVLTVRSHERALEAAKFFRPLFATAAVPVRARVINRWFDAREAVDGLEQLDAQLDTNVTHVDPKDAEEAFTRAMAGTRTPAEKERALAAHIEEQRRRDIPLIEDFPLHPDEETDDFRDLGFTLQLRMMRSYEHWRGDTVTLAELIHRLVERNA